MDFLSIVQTNNEAITGLAIGLSGAALLLWLLSAWRISRLNKKYNTMMQGSEGKNLEEMLTAHLNNVNKILEKTAEVEKAYQTVKKMVEKSIQKVGVVRFNAFSDTGSDLSFAVALLDHHGDGLVISSLFGRNESRIYTKPVNAGNSSYNLSVEEEEAIRKALEQVN